MMRGMSQVGMLWLLLNVRRRSSPSSGIGWIYGWYAQDVMRLTVVVGLVSVDLDWYVCDGVMMLMQADLVVWRRRRL